MWMMFSGLSCNRPADGGGGALPEPAADAPRADQPGAATAVFAGGCFWCVEAVFEQLEGVSDVVSGYAGGEAQTADYRQVSAGRTDHAEVVRVTYDPSKITYGQLLRVFFATHDPTTLNRQGPDVGRQYRSAAFYADDEQRQLAEQYIAQLNQAGVYDQPIVTTLEPLEGFYPAERYHQDFMANNPDHPYIQAHAVKKVNKTRQKFGELTKPPGE